MKKQYLIVGASSAIAKATMQAMASEANFIGLSRNPEGADMFHWDMHSEDSVLPEIDAPLNGLLYCPGTIMLKPFAQIQLADFKKDWDIHVGGLIRVLQKYHPQLKAAGDASVVAISTVAVQNGMPFHASVAAAKGALEGLLRSLAAEWAPTIRVNGIAPSLTETPMAVRLLRNEVQREAAAQRHPLKRIGTPEDIASAAAFLLSDQSSWITGQILHVDGGMSKVRN
jgi:NAD(P)-dependent dehydrogenase (short-subunit alcohol dehydrogenase family)